MNPVETALFTLRSAAPIDRRRLAEKSVQDMIDQHVVLLLKAGVGDPRHHRELLVGIRQRREEGGEILESGDTVILAAHDDRRRQYLLRVHQRQLGTHVDVRAVGDGIIQRRNRLGERVDHVVGSGAGVIAAENGLNECAIDRAPLRFEELR